MRQGICFLLFAFFAPPLLWMFVCPRLHYVFLRFLKLAFAGGGLVLWGYISFYSCKVVVAVDTNSGCYIVAVKYGVISVVELTVFEVSP